MENKQTIDGKTVDEVMAALRASVVPAIAHELAPIVESTSDRELAQQIARQSAIAAARAVEPAFERLQDYLLLSLQLASKLNEALEVIALLRANPATSNSKPN
jgi:hypothetical protein